MFDNDARNERIEKAEQRLVSLDREWTNDGRGWNDAG